MGTKVNPTGFRLGQTVNWNSNWRSNKYQYSNKIHLDLQIRKLIQQTLKDFGILIGKILIREVHLDKPYLIIQGNYYMTQNFVKLTYPKNKNKHTNFKTFKQNKQRINFKTLNKELNNLINKKIKNLIFEFLNEISHKPILVLDLTNILELGQKHTLKIFNEVNWQLRGPIGRPYYTKDLYTLCHKMVILKDTNLFGNAVMPLLEKTPKHHIIINNVEKICQIVFKQYKGINGLRLDFKGRIGGSKRSRSRSLKLGKLSTQKIDSTIDYTIHKAITRYGVCSLKMWLC
jgi:hypothetical protein